jgi:hypothetical protein
MRTWRVGTISMGASLLFLGVFLLLSQFAGWDLTRVMISWWPIILIVLGIEILVYLFLAKSEKPILKYDFLSIFFVGIIGMAGIGFAVISATGLLDVVDETLSREERTLDLPTLSQALEGNIKRVVVNAEHYPVHVEGTPSQEVSVFGTYTSSVSKGKGPITEVEDYLSVNKKGDTLYLNVKRMPEESIAFNHYYGSIDATILVPENVKLEVVAQDNLVTLKPREMKSDWIIESASNVSLYVEEKSDLDISANQVNELVSEAGEWTISSEEENSDEESFPFKSGRMKIGEGTHSISIVKAYEVTLSMLNK